MALNDQMMSTMAALNAGQVQAQPQQQAQAQDPNAALMGILQAILSRPQPQQIQPDYAGIFGAMRNTPQADANAGYIPGVDNQFSPFANGFFGGPPQSSVAGLPSQGVPPRTDAGSNPYAFGALGTPNVMPVAPFNMPPPMPTGPVQGMINPGLPDAQRYQDFNMFGVSPQTGLVGDQVIGDERGPQLQRKKSKPGNFGSPASKPFMFGAGSR